MDAGVQRRNRWAFAAGTVGRDMVYSLMALFLIVYLSEVLDLDNATLAWVNGILLAARLFDAFTDLIMGGIIDNTRTRWGQFKPWIALGVVLAAVCTVLLFTDYGVRGPGFLALFAVIYLAWGLSFTMNDIGYWSLLPSLTVDQRERERISALTKVFATVGLFTTVVAVIPVTTALGGDAHAWWLFAVGVAVLMVLGQLITLVGVREPTSPPLRQHTKIRELAGIIGRNDQLLWTALAMTLILIAYNTTTSFGVYFFKYVYRDEGMYAPFALILGVGQLLGFILFPLLRARLSRCRLFTLATCMLVAGYVVFFLSPMNMVSIGISGLLLFVGQAFMVVLMIVFLTDCIEYGQWRTGRRNGAVTFAVQPFVNKVGGAFATAIVGATLIVTGINEAPTPADVSDAGLWGLRVMMLVFPPVLIVCAYALHRRFHRIDEAMHARIVADLQARADVADGVPPPPAGGGGAAG